MIRTGCLLIWSAMALSAGVGQAGRAVSISVTAGKYPPTAYHAAYLKCPKPAGEEAKKSLQNVMAVMLRPRQPRRDLFPAPVRFPFFLCSFLFPLFFLHLCLLI
jgi:hypothetical protein